MQNILQNKTQNWEKQLQLDMCRLFQMYMVEIQHDFISNRLKPNIFTSLTK